MTIPSCPDICTAEKCRELEARIFALEQALETHLLQEIPEAHNYNSNLKIDGIYQNETLNLTVADGNSQDTTEILISLEHSHEVRIDITNPNDNEYEFQVSVDNNNDSEILTLSNRESNLKIDGTVDNQILYLTIADGNSEDTAGIPIPLEHTHDVQVVANAFRSSDNNDDITIAITVEVDEQQDNAQIPISLQHTHDVQVVANAFRSLDNNDDITIAITVQVDEQEDSTQFPISLNNFKPFVTVDVFPVGNEYVIQVSVNGNSDSDSFLIEIPEMNCDELIDKIAECCDRLITKIDNTRDYLVAEIEESENNLNNELFVLRNLLSQEIAGVRGKVEDVEQWVTVDISGATVGNLNCEFTKDKKGNVIPQYAQSIGSEIGYGGTGLQGIHSNLQIINANLAAIHSDVCKAVDPIFNIGVDDLYQFCDDSGIKRENFPDDKFGQERYNKAVQDYFQALLAETKYGYLLSDDFETLNEDSNNNNTGSQFLISAPSNWITNFIADFSLIQSKINLNKICQIEESEPQDVVTLVASEKELHRVDGKQLILAFVTLDNYPKRKRDSSWRPIQIPAPKESYNWITDFKNLRWQQGNQYAELVLEGYKHGVSGWFENEAAADSFFNAVLNLTTAIEVNRLYPKHKNPKTAYTVRPSRPWRAYVSKIKADGTGETLTTYFPGPNEEN